jgi:uncharacterized membrane protein YfcA
MLSAAFAGSMLAAHAPLSLLAGVFAVVALIVAIKMLLPFDEMRVANEAPAGSTGIAASGVIGGVSAIMGIGAGTLAVPTLNLCGYPIHRAVGTSALFGLFISVPGTIGYLIAQPNTNLPWVTVGFVSLAGLAIIGPVSMLTAPFGVRVAHGLSRRRLSVAFGVFLVVVASRMAYRAFG